MREAYSNPAGLAARHPETTGDRLQDQPDISADRVAHSTPDEAEEVGKYIIGNLKKVWKIWSDLITFEWVDRLTLKAPHVADRIFFGLLFIGLIIFVYGAFGAATLRDHFSPINWVRLIGAGALFATGALVIAYISIKHFWKAMPICLKKSDPKS